MKVPIFTPLSLVKNGFKVYAFDWSFLGKSNQNLTIKAYLKVQK